jgi:3-oxoacyl-[acyl-carrier protein] reductase
MSLRLANKVAVITGGGRGIGAATARLFLAEGAAVVVWEVDEPSAGRAIEGFSDLRSAVESARLSVRAVDVTDAAQVARGVEAALAQHQRVDVLVNNAGVIADAFASDLSLEQWERVLRVNLTGTFLPSKALIPHLRARRRGAIVNTSSTSALGNRGQANYAASKAGVIGLTRTLALELARDGVRVNCVAPGTIETDMFRQVPDKVREKFLARIPIGRFGQPEEVARLHLFLASDESSFITGQAIFCDGGLSL